MVKTIGYAYHLYITYWHLYTQQLIQFKVVKPIQATGRINIHGI